MSDAEGLPPGPRPAAPTPPLQAIRRLLPELRDLAIHFGLRSLPIETCSTVGATLGRTMGRRGHPNAEARARAVLPRLRPDLAAPDALETALVGLWENAGGPRRVLRDPPHAAG